MPSSPATPPKPTTPTPATTAEQGIDPNDLATVLRVVEQLGDLAPDHPDVVAVQRATAHVFKQVKKQRRIVRRDAIRAADEAVIAATATGSPTRLDDETEGIPLLSATAGPSAGRLIRPQACYICKQLFVDVDAFYHQLCPECAAKSHARRNPHVDLTGRRALLTGGRAKIGMYIALMLLRDGAHTTITTRFPNDAARRFMAMPDAAQWIHRLRIVGIDLRDPAQVIALADSVAAAGPLDILINNAAQTVRRSTGAYSALADAEDAPLTLPEGREGIVIPEILGFGETTQLHPTALVGAELPALEAATTHQGESSDVEQAMRLRDAASESAQRLTDLALTAGSASFDRIEAGTAIDAGGLIPDLVDINSWTQHVHQVDPLELLEVQLCNQTAPFILISRLRPSMAAAMARRKYVVNVSAMEGQFSRRYKGPGHPHTNMSKAALNMLTRTSAEEMLETDRILMTAVDTGWITDERPHTTKVRLAAEGFHAPLDLVDGAARVYDPIVRGEQGEDLYGCFLKDYEPSPW